MSSRLRDLPLQTPVRFFAEGVRKGWTALREGRLPASPAWWLKMLRLHWREVAGTAADLPSPQPFDRARLDASYRQWLQATGALASSAPGRLAAHRSPTGPPITVVALVDDLARVAGIIGSVRAQSYAHWDLWLVCLHPTAGRDHINDTEWDQSRVHLLGIDQLTRPDGSWSPPGESEFVVLIAPQTVLAPDALSHVVAAAGRSEADWIYTDDDRIDGAGLRCDPNLKGAFSPALAVVDDYATRLAMVRRAAIEQAGAFRSEYLDAQIYELLLRIVARPGRIEHLPEICCHRYDLNPAILSPRHRLAADRFFSDRGVPATLRVESGRPHIDFAVQQVHWTHAIPAVTIVIPTRDRIDLLRACVESLRRTVDPRRTQLLIVDDCSHEPATAEYLERLQDDAPLRSRVIRPLRSKETFNYARLMNAALDHLDTPLVLHLNNDVEAIASGWLDQMAGWLELSEVGIVGARLLYPDGAIQHAGVVVAPRQGVLEHQFRRLAASDAGYQWLPHRTRNVGAVTGACLLTRTALLRELGGFDEEHLAVQFNDIDYCLKVAGAGKRIVYESSAVLYHRSSASRGRVYDYRETAFFLKKYRDYRDPFLSPHLDPASLCGPTPEFVPLSANPSSGTRESQ